MAAYDVDRLLSTARERLAAAQTAEKDNRVEAETDLMFKVGGKGQWNADAYQERKDKNRPALTINQLDVFSNQVNNEIRQSQPALHISPKRDATADTAEVLEGMARAIQYETDAELGYDMASRYAVDSGFGCLRIVTEISDAETGEQEIKIVPVYDPSTAYCDPTAKKPTREDARWWIVLDCMSKIEYRERWPDTAAEANGFWPENAEFANWMSPSKDSDSIVVAEYYCVEKIDSSAVAYGAELNDDAPEEEKAERRRKSDYARVAKFNRDRGLDRIVVKHLINGVEELEDPVPLPGEWIPIFPVYGEETWIKGVRHISSLLRNSRDAQVLYNWAATKMAETLAMASTNPYLLTPRMVMNQENAWKNINNTNSTYLLYNPDEKMPGGPQRVWSEPPIAALSAEKTQARQEIRDTIGLQDPSLGQPSFAGQSGIATNNLQRAGATATYHYQDNLKRTVKYLGKVLLFWIPFYYDTEREVRVLGEDMQAEIVRVNTPGPYTDPATGQSYQHRLDKGRYEVVCTMAPSTQTARQEADAMYAQFMASNSDLVDLYAYLYFKNSDTAGAKDAADLVQRAVAMKMPGIFQDQQNGLPPGVSAQVQAMQTQMQQQAQTIQQLTQLVKSRGLEKQMQVQSNERIAALKSHTDLAKTALQGRTDIAGKIIDAKTDIHGDMLDHAHDMFKTRVSAAHDAISQLMDMLHESESAGQPDPIAEGSVQGLPEQQPS